MKLLAIATFAAGLALSSAAGAAQIVGLYDTGVDNAGVATTGDAADLHWTLSTQDQKYGPAAYTSGVNGTWPIGPWLAEDATSRWITPTTNASDSLDTPKTGPDGFYDYTLSFSMLPFSAASFEGQFAADNDVVSILLNGHALTTAAPGNPLGGFDHWTGFSASTADFVAGQNTLTFEVRNWAWDSGNATGFRAEFLDSSVTGVPEPAAWALMIVGFGGAGAALRQRRRRAVAA